MANPSNQARTATDVSNFDGHSVAFSVPSGLTDPLLVVRLTVRDPDTVTGVTYNGVALTKAADGNTGSEHAQIWHLVNPSTGSNTLAFTTNGACDGHYMVEVWDNIDQSTPLNDGQGVGQAASTTITDTVNVANANSLIVDTVYDEDGSPAGSPNADQTGSGGEWYEPSFYGCGYSHFIEADTGDRSWGWSGEDLNAMAVAVFNPTPAVAAGDVAEVSGIANADIAAVAGIDAADIAAIDGVTY